MDYKSLSMDYQSTLDWLYSCLPMFSRVGAPAYKPGLDTSLQLDAYFGHPHRNFKIIHVAGTNGKGSCSHMLAAILQAQGYKTALYTSPHLVDFRERMRINGDMIPRDNVVDFVRRFRDSNYPGKPSFFELTMMMAFDWFAAEKVDYAVIETGMGGRLDSTNIVTPTGCVITNISPDHTQFLGDTLPAIAAEKAGIIKRGIPVTIGESAGNVRKVFADKAAEMGAEISFADDRAGEMTFERDADGGWNITTADGRSLHSPLSGEYQRKNIGTVLCAVDMLRRAGMTISDRSIERGLREVESLTGLRGRWTRLSQNPTVIADTGHNEAGLTYNMEQLRRLRDDHPGCRLRIVAGFVADKAVSKILPLFPGDAEYYLTQAAIPRALPIEQLQAVAAEAGICGKAFPTVAEAYRAALADAGADDIIYVGGSTFVVADLLASLG